jgi:hypothetical protein
MVANKLKLRGISVEAMMTYIKVAKRSQDIVHNEQHKNKIILSDTNLNGGSTFASS